MNNPLEYAERIAYSSKEVLRFTYDMAMQFKDSPGVYVEAGVAAGAQLIAMHHGAPDKIIYGFDSFEGIPLPSNRDYQMPGIRNLKEWERKALPDPGQQALISSGATSVAMETVHENFKAAFGKEQFPNVTLIKGWFENTILIESQYIDEISLLRLDGDLYNSTFVCLQHLFPKVIQGGCVIIDDYGLKGCEDACKEYFELIGYEPDYQFITGKDYKVAYFFK